MPSRVVHVGFDQLTEGAVFGPFRYSLTAELCDRLRGPVGEARPGELAPPAVLLVLFLKAWADVFDGIPAGGLLTTEELEVHGVLPVDAKVDARVTIEEKRTGRGRPRVSVGFELAAPTGERYATGRMIIAWPKPEELS